MHPPAPVLNPDRDCIKVTVQSHKVRNQACLIPHFSLCEKTANPRGLPPQPAEMTGFLMLLGDFCKFWAFVLQIDDLISIVRQDFVSCHSRNPLCRNSFRAFMRQLLVSSHSIHSMFRWRLISFWILAHIPRTWTCLPPPSSASRRCRRPSTGRSGRLGRRRTCRKCTGAAEYSTTKGRCPPCPPPPVAAILPVWYNTRVN